MSAIAIEERLSALEAEISELKTQIPKVENTVTVPWFEHWFGAFKDDFTFDEAVRLGTEYRKSLPNAADNPNAITP